MILEEFRDKVATVLAAFETACAKAGVSHAAIEAEGGRPVGTGASARAGFLVMGAFGHTGLRECILGSATRTLLHRCAPPPLMVHH